MLQRAVVALVLLTAGLLLLGGLLADMETGIQDATEEANRLFLQQQDELPATPMVPPPDAGDTGAIESLRLTSPVEIEVPEGSQIEGDTLVLSEDTTIILPDGAQVQDLHHRLPPDTEIRLGEHPRILTGDTLSLGTGSRITFPQGDRLVLPEGGLLSDHGLTTDRLREIILDQRLLLDRPAQLTAPYAETRGEWRIDVEAGTRLVLPDSQEWGATNGNRTMDEIVPAGSRFHQMGTGDPGDDAGPPTFNATGIDTANAPPSLDPEPGPDEDPDPATARLAKIGAPPVWGWALLTAASLSLVGVIAKHRLRRRPRNPGPGFEVIARLDAREEDLPLALAPGQRAMLHVRVHAHDESARKHLTNARVDIRLPNGRRHQGPSTKPVSMMLSGLPEGDHVVPVQVRRHPLLPPVRMETRIRVAPWQRQIARDYQDMVDTLTRRSALVQGATPRQVRRALNELAPGLDPDTPSRAIAGFEEANYSPRNINEPDWLVFTRAARACRNAIRIPAPTPSSRRTPHRTSTPASGRPRRITG